MLRLALRPKWLALLALALLVATAFAALGSWQLQRSRSNATPVTIQPARPVADVLQPQTALPAVAATTPIIVTGQLIGDEAVTVSGRRHEGTPVRWLVAPIVVEGTTPPAKLPVVLGRLPADGPVPAVPSGPVEVTGLIQPSEDPTDAEPGGDHGSVSSADLIAGWGQPIYTGFLFADPALAEQAGVIAVAPPTQPTSTGFAILNLSYALQWWVFAVIACFLWWRVLRDAYTASQAEPSAPATEPSAPDTDDGAPDTDESAPRTDDSAAPKEDSVP